MLTFTHSIGPDVRIRFSEKPNACNRSLLKANGFRWSPASGQWWRPRVKGAADFLMALDRAINPRRPDGACWICKAPEGFFRPQGAATPVWCDACHAAVMQQVDIASECADPMGVDRAYEDACRDACGL
jgi:hypothetical protein